MKIDNIMKLNQPGNNTTKPDGFTYKIGQTLLARVVEVISEGLILLEDLKGNMFEAKGALPLTEHGSEYLTLIIDDIKNDTIFIKFKNESSYSNDDHIKTLLNHIGFKPTEDTIDLVKQLIINGLPATKENIVFMQKVKLSFTRVIEIINNRQEMLPIQLKGMDILETLKEVLKLDISQHLQSNTELKGIQGQDNYSNRIDYDKLAFLFKNELTMNLSNLDHINNIVLNRFPFTDQLNLLIQLLEEKPETADMARELKKTPRNLRSMILDKKWNPQENMKEIAVKILNITNKINNLKIENTRLFSQLENVKSSLEFISKVNQYQSFFQLPLQLDNQQKSVELYIMKNNKNSKMKTSQNSKIFISLNTNSMETVQVLIEINLNSINLKFFVANEGIKKFFSKFNNELRDIIRNIGYKNIELDFTLSQNEMNLLSIEEQYRHQNFNSIDLRV